MKKKFIAIILLFLMLFLSSCKSNASASENDIVYKKENSISYVNIDTQNFFSFDIEMYNYTDTYYYYRIIIVPNTYKYYIKNDFFVSIQLSSSDIHAPLIKKTEEDYFTAEHLSVYYASYNENPKIQIKYIVNYCEKVSEK